ncbi:MAG: hypothetical protein ACPLKQ_06840 [Candidatus Bathyarchaeales archaeon]
MPTITPSYLYTFFAVMVVSSILVASFMDYSGVIRFSAETRKLKNLMDHVAAETTELLNLAAANATAETFIQAPSAIGNTQYWLRLRNDSLKAWLEGGFGNLPTKDAELRVYLPSRVSASGFYISGYGAIHITCFVNSSLPNLQLSSSSLNGG